MEVMINIIELSGLTEFEWEVLLKLVLASICGGMIGLEREIKGRPAGMKTFSLVCIGAALIMITNDYICRFNAHGTGDLARMPAQVVSGIGFLGAGSIMMTGHNQVKGLTTAAALWVTAALGIVIGCGFYFGSIVGICAVYFSAFFYRYCDRKLMEKSRNMRICIEGENEEVLLCLIDYFAKQNISVKALQRKSDHKWYEADICAIIELQFAKRTVHTETLAQIKKIQGVRCVEEL